MGKRKIMNMNFCVHILDTDYEIDPKLKCDKENGLKTPKPILIFMFFPRSSVIEHFPQSFGTAKCCVLRTSIVFFESSFFQVVDFAIIPKLVLYFEFSTWELGNNLSPQQQFHRERTS